MKKYLILLFIFCFSLSLSALDVVTLNDSSIYKGVVSSYSSLGEITIDVEDGTIVTFPSQRVLSIERSGKIGVSLGIKVDPFIYYHEGVNKFFEYVPPRYTYRGMSYNIDTDWGMGCDVAEFFSYLKEQHPDVDEKTVTLMNELEYKMKRQNVSMAIGGALLASGAFMTFLPLNFDDIAATPTYGKVIALSGVTFSLTGLGFFIYNAFIYHREYPQLIADSFNEWVSRPL